MKALVTGASGFIGSTLIEELGTLGFEVYALLRRSSSTANLEGLKYQRVDGDLSDKEALKRAVTGMDYVFHLAGAITGNSKEMLIKHNADGTRLLAEAVAEARPGLTRFVFVSSLAASGPAESNEAPKEESQSDKPVSGYGVSKLQAEKELLKFKHVFPISIIRPPMVYGPKDKATFIFVQTVQRNLIPLFRGSSGGDHKYYSTIHVKDLVRGIVQSALAPVEKVPSGEVFYLSSDDVVTYETLMTTIAENLNREPLKIRVPVIALQAAAVGLTALGKVTNKTFSLNLDKLNEILPDYWVCSNQKAKNLLGFAPEFDLPKGMSQTIEWYKRQKWV